MSNRRIDEKKYSRGCAMIKFNSLSKAEEAIQLYDNFQTFTGNSVPIKLKINENEYERYNLKGGDGSIYPKLEVFNIPLSRNEDDIIKLFSSFGKIEEVRLRKDQNGVHKGIALVKYLYKESMIYAMKQLNGFSFPESELPLLVKGFGSKFQHVSAFADPKVENIVKDFARSQNEIKDSKTYTGSGDSNQDQIIYIEFQDDTNTPYYYNTLTKKVQWEFPSGNFLIAKSLKKNNPKKDYKTKKLDSSESPVSQLTISNIPGDWNEEDLSKEFSEFGEIDCIKLSNINHQGKKTGLVNFKKVESAIKSRTNLNGIVIQGSKLSVEYKKPDDFY